MIHDTIIIGTGPTGLTAAMFAARRKLNILVIGKQIGGQLIWASTIENMPGFSSIKSYDLINKMQEQLKLLDVQIINAEVNSITRDKQNIFNIMAAGQIYRSKTVILAIGLSPRRLNVPGEERFTGKGVSYCANCDGPLYKNKVVAVVGGGNAALDAAEVLSKIARQVYLIYRGEILRGFEILAAKVRWRKNIIIKYNSLITEVIGMTKLEKVILSRNKIGQIEELKLDGLFVEIGHEAQTDLVANLVERDEKNQIVVDQNCRTSLDGMFAAGDVTQNEYKQIVIGCGQGAVAALSAYRYLQIK